MPSLKIIAYDLKDATSSDYTKLEEVIKTNFPNNSRKLLNTTWAIEDPRSPIEVGRVISPFINLSRGDKLLVDHISKDVAVFGFSQIDIGWSRDRLRKP